MLSFCLRLLGTHCPARNCTIAQLNACRTCSLYPILPTGTRLDPQNRWCCCTSDYARQMVRMGQGDTSGAVAARLTAFGEQSRDKLDRTGLVRLSGVISPEWLAAARTDVDRYIACHGPGEHSMVEPDHWECPTITALAVDEGVKSFLHSLAPTSLAEQPGFSGYRQRVLRILDGSAVDSPPFDWHYDANATTMLVPIVIPKDDMGQLALFPDNRPHRRWATLSAAERLIVHNGAYGRRMRQRFESNPSEYTLPITPGDAYLFHGYRALHATLPWPSNTLRVTLLLQYGHPYGQEGTVVRAVRARRNSLRSRRTEPRVHQDAAQ